jgi:hypothetical protein
MSITGTYLLHLWFPMDSVLNVHADISPHLTSIKRHNYLIAKYETYRSNTTLPRRFITSTAAHQAQ